MNITSMIITVILVLIPYISLRTVNSKCPSYTHKPISDKSICLEQLTLYEYLIQDCPPKHECILNDNKDSGRCELSNASIYDLSYPGSKCLSNDDCNSLQCINNICQGAQLGAQCTSTADCFFGHVCSNKGNFCDNPKPKNSLCSDHTQCEFPLLCHQGRCTQLFSIENGIEVNEADHFLCKSGKVYNGICNQIKNINEDCDDDKTPCQYEDVSGNKLIIESACHCTISPNATNSNKKCLKGDIDNQAWLNALGIIKESMNKEYTSKCNLEERRPGYCLEQLKTNWTSRQKQIQLDSYLIESEYSPLIPVDNNKLTILNTLFGLDKSMIQPLNGFKCPIYNSTIPNDLIINKDTCVAAVNPFNEQGDGLIAYVNTAACDIDEGYQCDYDPNQINSHWTYNATCIEKKQWKSRYHLKLPGDECNESSQCQPLNEESSGFTSNYSDIGLCIEGICSGHSIGQQCRSHSDCLIGLYCNESLICDKQRRIGGQCRDEYDCENQYGCMNNTCIEYYSLSKGEYLNGTNPDKAFCEFGFEDEITHECVELSYYNQSNSNEDGFIECDNLSPYPQCNYTYGNDNEVITKQCQCGFNSYGKAFCPLSHNEHRSKWKQYHKTKRKMKANKCHTLKRDACPGYDYTNDINHYRRISELAHLFYLADEDVIRVLNGSKLQLNILTIIGLSIYLFI